MKPVKTLVLLADDAQARLFENLGPGKGLTEIEDFNVKMVPEAGSGYADRTGRNSAAPGMAQHGVADQAEAERDQAREAFARAVLAETEARFRGRGAERFVLIAAPATLGVLRDHLPADLRKAMVLDLPKDYVNLTPSEVVEHLEDKIAL